MQTKQIVEILGKYFDKPKKSGQNLNDHELTVVFEYLTQHNQASSIESIYADVPASAPAPAPQEPEKAKAEPQGQQKKGGGQQQQSGQKKGRQQQSAKPQQSNAPQGGRQQRPQQQQQQQKGGQQQGQQQQQQPASRVPKTKVVDTRKATNVNLDKYDEKLQDMAERSDRSGGRRDREQSKETAQTPAGGG